MLANLLITPSDSNRRVANNIIINIIIFITLYYRSPWDTTNSISSFLLSLPAPQHDISPVQWVAR